MLDVSVLPLGAPGLISVLTSPLYVITLCLHSTMYISVIEVAGSIWRRGHSYYVCKGPKRESSYSNMCLSFLGGAHSLLIALRTRCNYTTRHLAQPLAGSEPSENGTFHYNPRSRSTTCNPPPSPLSEPEC